jgi:arylsulfatase
MRSEPGATQGNGITLWEVTIAEALKSVGYGTGTLRQVASGRRRAGREARADAPGLRRVLRIPRTSNEAQTTIANGSTQPGTSFIWEGRAGQPSRNVKLFDMETRRTVDRESAERGIAFMERNVKERKPFFMYYAMTQIHFPTLAHHDFEGKTAPGTSPTPWRKPTTTSASCSMRSIGLKITRNTIVLWCPDNGAEARRPWRGSVGSMERLLQHGHGGGIRTPCLVRWPGAVPAGRVSNEIVHEIDLFPDVRRRSRRGHRAEGSRDRRRESAAVLRGQAGRSRTARTSSSTRTRSSRREVARLEVPLRIPA